MAGNSCAICCDVVMKRTASSIKSVTTRTCTMTDAESKLRALLEEVARKHHYNNYDIQLKFFQTGGANYTSELFFITLSAPDKEDLKLFAKVASVGPKFRSTGYIDRFYVAEQQFYNEIISVWIELQEKYQIPENDKYVFPKFYGSNPKHGSETVVLENLSENGYKTYNRFKSIDWEYAAKSAEMLAKFHAFSFIHQKEYPEEYEQITEKLKFELPKEDQNMTEMFHKMVGRSLEVLSEENRGKILKFLGDNAREKYAKYNSPRRHKILVHGDFRPSNLMHKEKDGELVIVPVDYQTLHIGCPVIDIIYFLFMGSDEAFRAKHWDQFLDHYYEQLSQQLRRFKMDPTEVYPREEFDEDMKEMLPYALIIGVMTLPVITVEAEHAPQMSGDADLETFIVKPNELFTARFRGLVDDCLRWGVI